MKIRQAAPMIYAEELKAMKQLHAALLFSDLKKQKPC